MNIDDDVVEGIKEVGLSLDALLGPVLAKDLAVNQTRRVRCDAIAGAIGKKLGDIRKFRQLSIEDVANILDINVTALSNIETGALGSLTLSRFLHLILLLCGNDAFSAVTDALISVLPSGFSKFSPSDVIDVSPMLGELENNKNEKNDM